MLPMVKVHRQFLHNNIKQFKTPSEITQCIENAIKESIVERHFNFKESLITCIAWLLAFLAVFALHYPHFRTKQ
jgi:hypothetical protein